MNRFALALFFAGWMTGAACGLFLGHVEPLHGLTDAQSCALLFSEAPRCR